MGTCERLLGSEWGGEPCSVAQIRLADERAILGLGIPGCVLMFSAGKCVAREIDETFPHASEVVVLAGRGNNGGDGFVVAHLLHMAGRNVHVRCAAREEDYGGDALTYMKLCLSEGVDVAFMDPGPFPRCDVVVDALLGTGFAGQVAEPVSSFIQRIPPAVPVVAVDVPSGLNADTGEISSPCVRAALTVTFARLKRGLVNRRGVTGRVVVADIGIPDVCFRDDAWGADGRMRRNGA